MADIVLGGAWEKVKVIGRGGSSTVYKCVVKNSGDYIAVKEIITDGMTTEQVRAIGSEVDTIKTLNHSNIVRCFGSQQKANKLYIILEYCDRGSLRQYYQKFGKMTEPQAANAILQILSGLQYLHANGIAHRDVKGANILLTKLGQLKLADSGASKRMEMESLVSGLKGMSQRVSLFSFMCRLLFVDYVGTPHWMAPEVIKGTQMTTGWMKADVWSVGCTLVEILTAALPFAEYENPMTAMYQIASGKIPPLPESASEEARAFVCNCCASDPDMRPSVSELINHPFVSKYVSRDSSGKYSVVWVSFDDLDAALSKSDQKISDHANTLQAVTASDPVDIVTNVEKRIETSQGEIGSGVAVPRPPELLISSEGSEMDTAAAVDQFIEAKKSKRASQAPTGLSTKSSFKSSALRADDQSTSSMSVDMSGGVSAPIEDSVASSMEYQVTPDLSRHRKTLNAQPKPSNTPKAVGSSKPAPRIDNSHAATDIAADGGQRPGSSMENQDTPVLHKRQKNINMASQPNLLQLVQEQVPPVLSLPPADSHPGNTAAPSVADTSIRLEDHEIAADVLSPRMSALKVSGTAGAFFGEGQPLGMEASTGRAIEEAEAEVAQAAVPVVLKKSSATVKVSAPSEVPQRESSIVKKQSGVNGKSKRSDRARHAVHEVPHSNAESELSASGRRQPGFRHEDQSSYVSPRAVKESNFEELPLSGTKRKLRRSPGTGVQNKTSARPRKESHSQAVPAKLGTVAVPIDITVNAALPPVQLQLPSLAGSKLPKKERMVRLCVDILFSCDDAVIQENFAGLVDNLQSTSENQPSARDPVGGGTDRLRQPSDLSESGKLGLSSKLRSSIPRNESISAMAHSSSATSILGGSTSNSIAEASLIAAESNFGRFGSTGERSGPIVETNLELQDRAPLHAVPHRILLNQAHRQPNVPGVMGGPPPHRQRLAVLRAEAAAAVNGVRSHSAGIPGPGGPERGPNKHKLPSIRGNTSAQSNDTDTSMRIIQTAPVVSRAPNLPPLPLVGSATPVLKPSKGLPPLGSGVK
jgi:serine/threonine protein kinase